MHLKCSSLRIRDAVNVPYQSSIKMSAPQAPLDLTRQPDISKQQQPQQQGPIEQPPEPTPVEQPKAPAPVAAQPAAVAPPPQQPKPTGYAAIAASNTNAAPGIPSNPSHEPPADSFTSIGEWNQVRCNISFVLRVPCIQSPDINLFRRTLRARAAGTSPATEAEVGGEADAEETATDSAAGVEVEAEDATGPEESTGAASRTAVTVAITEVRS